MYVLGLWGGGGVDDAAVEGGGHDASAVLLSNGECIAGIEEERISRVKHTRQAPIKALQWCLAKAGIEGAQLARIAVGRREHPGIRRAVRDGLGTFLGHEISDERLVLVEHHLAHAYSAYAQSGAEEALVVSIDGMGDDLAGTVHAGRGHSMERLRANTVPNSLGHLYLRVTAHLGYGLFDEYKVMGLAPYGDPARFRDVIQQLYSLEPEGEYRLFLDRATVLSAAGPRRMSGEAFTQEHKDLAAAVQEALERIVFHMLRHFQKQTRMTTLCLAGGVAHNCTVNGKLLTSGLFERVFVQPAAHDAGTALGAALYATMESGQVPRLRPLQHVYWGTDLPGVADVEAELCRWHECIEFHRSDDVCAETARLLADGAVVGWVQGRSEFGPRALGNRSILADPRPAENKSIINQMVKKREGYRPFAPSVLAERMRDFFVVPDNRDDLGFMTFVVDVRPEQRSTLGAITHVDGTARVQSVQRTHNERYWRVIHEFEQLTGIPILLNTSFNNNVEPIVDTVRDAIVCYLTTGLNVLVVGDYIARKIEPRTWSCLDLCPAQPTHVELRHSKKFFFDAPTERYSLHHENAAKRSTDSVSATLSDAAYRILREADGTKTLSALADAVGAQEQRTAIETEFEALWQRRMVNFTPRVA